MLAELPSLFYWPFVVVLGLALGSFTTCAVYRIPRGISMVRRNVGTGAYRSHCPHCMTTLSARDLVPILSWVVQGGKCRHCRHTIGLHYLLIEILVLILVMVLAFWARS